jgi:uncharacterized protein YndB with AHSA1/START domain
MDHKTIIVLTVQTIINAPVEKVWNCWTNPNDIVKWNFALETWHTPKAENDLREGGSFNYRMEAKDGSMGFDFYGVYDRIVVNELIDLTLGDGRTVKIIFKNNNNNTEIVEIFEAENINSGEQQRIGWQAILDNFKKHVEEIKL